MRQGIRLAPPAGRSETCACGADLRVCLNCVSYDGRVAEHCQDRRVQEIIVPDRGNFCEWFELRAREWRPPTQDTRREASARDALKRLLAD